MASNSHALLGAYVGVPDSNSAAEADVTQQYNSFVSAMGQAPGVMDSYVDTTLPESQWVSDSQWLADSWKANSWSAGLTPIVGLAMASEGEDADQSFKNISSGSEDSVFRGIFQAWANAGYSQFDIRPGYEMNGDWMPWSVTSGNVADFNAAFQHIANLAHSFNGASIQVVWNPNVGSSPVPVSDLYPGDQSVDIVGLDTYGPPVDNGDAPGNTSSDPNMVTLLNSIALANGHGKQFAIPETGGTDPAFAAAMGNTIAKSGANLAFFNIWDINDQSGHLSWSDQPDVAAAWKQAFQAIAGGSSSTSAPAQTVSSAAVSASGSSNGASINSTSASPATVSVTDNATGAAASIDATSAHSETDFGSSFDLTAPGTAQVYLGGTAQSLNFVGMTGIDLTAGSASATVKSDGGTNTFTAGGGTLDVTGGRGADTYIYNAGAARLTVEDFSASKGDVLQVDSSLQGSLVTASDGHGGTMLTFGMASGGIDLKGVSQMSADKIAWS